MRLRAAILGAGNMGKGHAKRLQKAGADVVAVCDSNEEARKKFLEVAGGEIKDYADFDDMLNNSQFDVLFICLPPFAQTDQFEKAANKKKHIFIEKPIALNTETGKRMVDAAKKNGIVTQVGFHMRYGAVTQKLRKLIQEGKTGRPVLFQGNYQCNSLHTPWWINVDLCGGQIFEQAIHLYDMSRYLFGNPKTVMGVTNNLCHNDNFAYTVEDVSASVANYTNGAVASITATNCAVPDKWIGSFMVVYEHVTVHGEDSNHGTFSYIKEGKVSTEQVNADVDQYQLEVDEFVDCVLKKKQPECNILEGYKSLAYVEAVVRSAQMDGNKIAIK